MAGVFEGAKDKESEASTEDPASSAEQQEGVGVGLSSQERGIIVGHMLSELFDSAYHEPELGKDFVETPGGRIYMN
jgi:hypothetical protein